LTVILKPGYAPIEQYADEPNMKQGAWTDIYAIAAVIHYAIVGKPPTPSVGRLMNDTTVPLAQAAAGRYSEGFLRGLDQALAVRPEKRPQDLSAFRDLIQLEDQRHATTKLQQSTRSSESSNRGGKDSRKGLFVAVGALTGVAIGIAAYFIAFREPPSASKVTAPSPTVSVADAVVKPPNEPSPAKPLAADPTVVPAAQSIEKLTPVQPPLAAEKGSLFNPADALEQVYERRAPDRAVTVELEKTEVKIGKGKLTFRVQSEKTGYLYILMVGTDKSHIYLLFPNALDRNNQVTAGKGINLPRPGWAMTAGGPPGINNFVAMVSDHPRDFTNVDLSKAGAFSEFSPSKVESLLRANVGDSAVLAGSPLCKSTTDCSSAYGAARFSIAEIN
jgi:hypothetical protein